LDHLAQGDLNAPAIQRRGGPMGGLQATVAIGKQPHRISVHGPKPAQRVECHLRQRDETVFIALGVADMHPLTRRVDIAYLEA
jgi:hypothetical protein